MPRNVSDLLSLVVKKPKGKILLLNVLDSLNATPPLLSTRLWDEIKQIAIELAEELEAKPAVIPSTKECPFGRPDDALRVLILAIQGKSSERFKRNPKPYIPKEARLYTVRTLYDCLNSIWDCTKKGVQPNKQIFDPQKAAVFLSNLGDEPYGPSYSTQKVTTLMDAAPLALLDDFDLGGYHNIFFATWRTKEEIDYDADGLRNRLGLSHFKDNDQLVMIDFELESAPNEKDPDKRKFAGPTVIEAETHARFKAVWSDNSNKSGYGWTVNLQTYSKDGEKTAGQKEIIARFVGRHETKFPTFIGNLVKASTVDNDDEIADQRYLDYLARRRREHAQTPVDDDYLVSQLSK